MFFLLFHPLARSPFASVPGIDAPGVGTFTYTVYCRSKRCGSLPEPTRVELGPDGCLEGRVGSGARLHTPQSGTWNFCCWTRLGIHIIFKKDFGERNAVALGVRIWLILGGIMRDLISSPYLDWQL